MTYRDRDRERRQRQVMYDLQEMGIIVLASALDRLRHQDEERGEESHDDTAHP